ncbi:helix-turn-helix transcriptional regulator [Nocardia niigatensis]
MRPFEFAFATPELKGPEDPRFDALLDQDIDATASSHGGLTVMTLVFDGDTAITAAQSAVRALLGVGLPPQRLVPDLVDRTEIAARSEVTRQAVSNWVRGDRRSIVPFPAPYGGEVWLWGDVVPWLREHGHLNDLVDYPTWREHAIIDGWLQSESMCVRPTPRRNTWDLVAEVAPRDVATTAEDPHGRRSYFQSGFRQDSYALAAGE